MLYFDTIGRQRMITSRENWMTLEEASICPTLTASRRGRKPVPYSTIYRWVTRGVKGAVLESRIVGGIRMVTPQAIEKFIEDATEARRYKPRQQGFTTRTPTKRRRDSEAATKRMRTKGI